MSYASGKLLKLKEKLNPTDTSLTADVDVGVTNGRLYFVSDSQEEWISFTGVSASGDNYSYTGLTRGLSQTADPSTAGTGKTWLAGSSGVLVAMHDQLADKQDDNTFSGTNTFKERIVTEKGVEATTFATTSARDTALGGDGAALYPYTNIYVTATGLFYNYNLSSGTWEEVDTGTVTPNASTTAAGKVEISEDAEITTPSSDTGGTGAFLSAKISQLIKLLGFAPTLTSSAEDDYYVFSDTDDSAKTKKMTKANLRNDLAGSKTLKGTFEMLTDAEATNGTDEERVPNSKQMKDNYGQAGFVSGASATFTDTSAHSGTLTISLGFPGVKTILMQGYLYVAEYNNPTWTKKKVHFKCYFHLGSSGITRLNDLVVSTNDSNTTEPVLETSKSSEITIGSINLKSTSAITTSDITGSTASITAVYVDGSDLKIDYSIGALSGPDNQSSGVIVNNIIIIN